MLNNGEMKNKELRKLQFGQYTKRRYKEIRRKVKKIVEEDFEIVNYCSRSLSEGFGSPVDASAEEVHD